MIVKTPDRMAAEKTVQESVLGRACRWTSGLAPCRIRASFNAENRRVSAPYLGASEITSGTNTTTVLLKTAWSRRARPLQKVRDQCSQHQTRDYKPQNLRDGALAFVFDRIAAQDKVEFKGRA